MLREGGMASKEIQREVARLRTELNRHNYLYYVEAQPEIGDGERGDDITANLKTVHEVPLVLQDCPASVLEVRGEVYMTNSELVRLNDLRRAAGEPPFANPRNSTAGSLKLLDPKLCGRRRL